MKWLRLYSEARNDAKLRSLTAEQFRVWFNLLCLAGEGDARGCIRADDGEVLAVEAADGDAALLAATLERLFRLRILVQDGACVRFLHWEERQYDHPSDRPAEAAARKRAQRDRERAARDRTPSFIDVTSESRAVTTSHTVDTDTDPDPDPDLSLTSASAPPIARELSDSWRLCACAALGRERLKPWEVTALAGAEAAGYSLAALSWSLDRAVTYARSPTGRVAYALSCIADAPTNQEETDPDAQEPARRLRAHPRHSDAGGQVRAEIDVGAYTRLYMDSATYHVPDVPGPGVGQSPAPEPDGREHPGL